MKNSSALTHLDIKKKQLVVENFGNILPPPRNSHFFDLHHFEAKHQKQL